MRLLFDANISYRIIKKVSGIAPGSLHVSRSGLTIPVTDYDIWRFAKSFDFVVVTFDEDFQDFSHLYGFPPKVILLRTGNTSTDSVAKILIDKWAELKAFNESGSAGLLEIF